MIVKIFKVFFLVFLIYSYTGCKTTKPVSHDGQFADSDYIFQGEVVQSHKSNLQVVPDSDNTYVVKVNNIILAHGRVSFLAFLKVNKLRPSMSRQENCHDNAVAESFLATFKKRVTQRKIYSTRDNAKTEIFNIIEMFYNPIKRHNLAGGVFPAKIEEDYFSRLESVWQRLRNPEL